MHNGLSTEAKGLLTTVQATGGMCELTEFSRFVYQHVFVANGNFTANHVWQTNPSNDVWLSEGIFCFPQNCNAKTNGMRHQFFMI